MEGRRTRRSGERHGNGFDWGSAGWILPEGRCLHFYFMEGTRAPGTIGYAVICKQHHPQVPLRLNSSEPRPCSREMSWPICGNEEPQAVLDRVARALKQWCLDGATAMTRGEHMNATLFKRPGPTSPLPSHAELEEQLKSLKSRLQRQQRGGSSVSSSRPP